MRNYLRLALTLILVVICLAACGKTELGPVSSDLDFQTSVYKHINNGGVTDDPTLPYNIDAITGATLTVEGPAVVSSTPLSIREVENLKSGLVRGQYEDEAGVNTYEGLDLYYLLHNMSDGDNGIILTDSAYKVVLKNANREETSVLTLAEIEAAHNAGRPIILAYGMGNAKGTETAPFVFDGADEKTHSLGYKDKLRNDDGCIKLVYDNEKYGSGNYKKFVNTAYVYICEENEPGFKHTASTDEAFRNTRYTDYIVTFRGSALGREINMTTAQLEALVPYDDNWQPVTGGIGYTDWYSLANNAYWYVNKYEGLQLYELLQYLGMDDAETMGRKLSRTTLVKFIASDGVAANETFSVETLSYPEAFGFYKKNAQDNGDGTFVPTNADLVKLGYPILLSYGVNNYPYTISKTDPEYVSGLSNSGGPLRVVFGKTQYNHPNGSNQIQLLSEIIAGDDILYNTHKYTDNKDLNVLAASTVAVTVKNTDGSKLISRNITVGEIEDLLYGPEVTNQVRKAAKVKDSYQAGENFKTDIYEGVSMEYFLMNAIGLPGMNGTITVSGAGNSVTMSLEELFKNGFNTHLDRGNQPSVLAFAKNGSPLVADKNSAGYTESAALKPFLPTDPASISVDNQGGPLMFIMPSSTADQADGQTVFSVESIEVDLIPDSYAHIDKKYAALAKSTIRFYGDGLEKEATYTVSDIESKQTQVRTIDFSMLNKSNTASEERYRGIAIYDLFKEIGINNNAGDVTVYCADGASYTYSLKYLKKAYENALHPEKDKAFAMIAYGKGDTEGDKMQGEPLTAEQGPLMLIVPQENKDAVNKSMCLKNIVAVHVSANEITTWSHSMSDVYSEFLDYKFTLAFKNDDNQWEKEYTVAELEAMEDIIVNDKYTVLDLGQCEGIDLWKLIKKTAGSDIPLTDLISITAYAEDGYSNDLLANCGKGAFENGVVSETGENKTIILAYALNGYPIVSNESHEGYTGLAGNCDGPLRVIVEGFQGGSIKYCNKVTVTIAGEGKIK